jgi:hypothetical protein
MATNVRKKISDLTALTSASLDTVIVGVDNGTTYKIELDVLADAVTSRVNILDRDRLSSLESVTSSFETKGRTLISSSAQISALGFTSSSADLTSLNSFTSSQTTLNSAFTNGINARLQTSSFNEFSASVHNEIVAATNEQDLTPYVTDLVYNVLSSSVDSRIDNLEANSGSYLTSLNGAISSSSQLTSSFDERYVLSGSITQTTWDNIANKPSGIVSQSTDLSLLNTFTESIDNRVDALESFSSSLNSTFATDLEVSIVSSSVAATIGVISQNTGLVSTSSFNQYTASQSTSSLVNRLNAIESVSGSWITESETGSFLTNLNGAISSSSQITALGFVSGSYLTSLSGAISSSSQLTSSFDERYTLSGSVGATPLGTISGSAQITAFGFISSSDSTTELNSYTASLNNAIELTGSTVSFLGNIIVYGTQSVINSQNVEISDNILYLSPTASTDNDLGVVGHYNDGTYRHAGIFMDASDGHSWKVFNGLQTETTATVDTSGTGFALADFKAGVITGTSFNGIINATNGVVSGSSQLSGTTIQNLSGSFTGSFRGNIAGTATYSDTTKLLNSNTNQDYSIVFTTSGSNGYLTQYTDGLSNLLYNPSTNRLKSVYLQGSIEANNGVISGSSQLTSSFDERYTLSGSVQPLPSDLISGSSQLTASFDARYLLSGSSTSRVFASDTAPSSPTQGDLWWKTNDGNLYVYYDSYWIVATDTISALPNGLISGSSQLPTLATTGSNSFNGNQTITGSLSMRDILYVGTGSGDEGGEIQLASPQTNTSLTNKVIVDVYQNRLRLWEGGVNGRGVYIDLSKAPAGNAGELIWKASGMVNAGTFVTLDNIKATVTSGSPYGLSIAAVSTTFSANISAYHAYTGGIAGTATNNQSVTTTPTTSLFGWSFPAEGDGAYYTIVDKTNSRMYRITLMIGASYNNNFISIERLF